MCAEEIAARTRSRTNPRSLSRARAGQSPSARSSVDRVASRRQVFDIESNQKKLTAGQTDRCGSLFHVQLDDIDRAAQNFERFVADRMTHGKSP